MIVSLNVLKLIGYILIGLIAFYVFLAAFIRLKMHFWHTQPVFHIYNLKYWLRPPGIINHEPPALNKFVNLSNNQMIEVANEVDANDIDTSSNSLVRTTSQISQFIRDYYVIHADAVYKPSKQDILAYLQCANQPAYFNIYKEDKMPFIAEQEMLGVISARLLNVTLVKKINKNKHKSPLNFPVYYIDNLCVKPGHRQKGIAPEMIQTLHYNISRANPKVNAYLFKREGKLNAIVPLVCYDTYAFDLTHYQTDFILTAAMTIIEIGIAQLNLFVAFMKEQMPNFECIILPDISSVLNLIKLGKIKIYGILFQGELTAVYIFRVLELYYADKKAIECITILSKKNTQSDIDNDILITGFTLSWAKISAETGCSIVLIEETAHSKAVILALLENPLIPLHFKSPTAFFLYNYATYSVKNTKALLFY
jgi:ribosomal protein S18 acetylase RimI-like enzyme